MLCVVRVFSAVLSCGLALEGARNSPGGEPYVVVCHHLSSGIAAVEANADGVTHLPDTRLVLRAIVYVLTLVEDASVFRRGECSGYVKYRPPEVLVSDHRTLGEPIQSHPSVELITSSDSSW